jgi:hypothetical protein
VAGLFVLVLMSLPHPHDEPRPSRAYTLKPGGEINLFEDTMIRDKLLTHGRYLVQHRVSAGEHTVIVTQVPDRKRIARPPAVVTATVLPAGTTYPDSVVYAEPPRDGRTSDRYYRIMKIDIAGEDVDHLF